MDIDNQFQQLISQIDRANKVSPVLEEQAGTQLSREYLYGLRMSAMLNTFSPNASTVLQIAARAQHIERWKISRDSYPAGKKGYLQWRSDLGKFHADTTAKLMAETKYSENDIDRVKDLLQKKCLKTDPETQTLEDVICLVFIQYYLEAFAAQHNNEKIIGIIRKTWRKMSEKGKEAALALSLPESVGQLIKAALKEN